MKQIYSSNNFSRRGVCPHHNSALQYLYTMSLTYGIAVITIPIHLPIPLGNGPGKVRKKLIYIGY